MKFQTIEELKKKLSWKNIFRHIQGLKKKECRPK